MVRTKEIALKKQIERAAAKLFAKQGNGYTRICEIAEIVLEGQDQGVFRKDFDPVMFRWIFYGSIMRLVWGFYRKNSFPEEEFYGYSEEDIIIALKRVIKTTLF